MGWGGGRGVKSEDFAAAVLKLAFSISAVMPVSSTMSLDKQTHFCLNDLLATVVWLAPFLPAVISDNAGGVVLVTASHHHNTSTLNRLVYSSSHDSL